MLDHIRGMGLPELYDYNVIGDLAIVVTIGASIPVIKDGVLENPPFTDGFSSTTCHAHLVQGFPSEPCLMTPKGSWILYAS